ncbi:MAG: SpoIIE family protein phosphatase [Leptospiraceae bacterium]|nr:SpoIIE family protein phosphatase [Leptospiraceae bacterium]
MKYILIFIVFLLLVSPLSSENTILLNFLEIYPVNSVLEIYEDKSAQLSLNDVLNVEFQPNINNTINFGLTNSAFWFRFKINNQTNLSLENWFLFIEFPQIDDIKIYFPSQKNYYIEKRIGDALPFHERELKIRFLNQRFPSETLQNEFIYMRVQTTSALTFPVIISTESLYMKKAYSEQVLVGIFIGAISIMVIYNLFLFISIKDLAYFYYTLSGLSFILYMLSFFGLGYELLWPNNPYLQSKMILTSVIAILVFLSGFCISFLDLKNLTPRLYKFILYTNLLPAPILLYFLYFQFNIILTKVLSFMTIAMSISMVFGGIVSLRKGNKIARFYLLGWVPFLGSAQIIVLRTLGIVSWLKIEYSYLVIFSNAVELIIFSFALADRINILKQEKAKAEAEVRQSLEKAKIELEIKVEERTKELNRSLEIIQKDLVFSGKIQKKLLPSSSLTISNIKIQSIYKPMGEVGGDFFDIAQLKDGIIRILIADATGHGVQAALITMLIKSEYETLKTIIDSPAQLLEMLNITFFPSIRI